MHIAQLHRIAGARYTSGIARWLIRVQLPTLLPPLFVYMAYGLCMVMSLGVGHGPRHRWIEW